MGLYCIKTSWVNIPRVRNVKNRATGVIPPIFKYWAIRVAPNRLDTRINGNVPRRNITIAKIKPMITPTYQVAEAKSQPSSSGRYVVIYTPEMKPANAMVNLLR